MLYLFCVTTKGNESKLAWFIALDRSITSKLFSICIHVVSHIQPFAFELVYPIQPSRPSCIYCYSTPFFLQQKLSHEMLKHCTTTKRGLIKNFHSRKETLSKYSNVLTTTGGMVVLTEWMVLFLAPMYNFLTMKVMVTLLSRGPRPRVYPLNVIPHQIVTLCHHLPPHAQPPPIVLAMTGFKVNSYYVIMSTNNRHHPALTSYQKKHNYHHSNEAHSNVLAHHLNHLRTRWNVHEV